MEFDILLYLAQKRGNVVSSEELFEKVWKEKYLENNNTVMVHIRRIREKLNEDTKKPSKTVSRLEKVQKEEPKKEVKVTNDNTFQVLFENYLYFSSLIILYL